MKNLIYILLAVISLSSCYSSENIQVTNNSNLIPYSIENVDDELGLAYGYTTETSGAKIITFKVVAPYEYITYDSISNIHYLDISKVEDNPDSLVSITIDSYKLAGI